MAKEEVSTFFSIRDTLSNLKEGDAFSGSPTLWLWADENLRDLSPEYGKTAENELASYVKKERELIDEYHRRDSEGRKVFRLNGKIVSVDEDEEVVVDQNGDEYDLAKFPRTDLNPVLEDVASFADEREETFSKEKEINLDTIPKRKFLNEVDLSGVEKSVDLSVLDPILEE